MPGEGLPGRGSVAGAHRHLPLLRDTLRAFHRLLPVRLRSRCSSGCLPASTGKVTRSGTENQGDPSLASRRGCGQVGAHCGAAAATARRHRRRRPLPGAERCLPRGIGPGRYRQRTPPALPYLPPPVPRCPRHRTPAPPVPLSRPRRRAAGGRGRASHGGGGAAEAGRERRDRGREGEDGGGGARVAGGGAVPRAGRHRHRRRHRHRQGHRRRPAGARWARGGLRRQPPWGSGARRLLRGWMEFEGPSGSARGLCCVLGAEGARGRAARSPWVGHCDRVGE